MPSSTPVLLRYVCIICPKRICVNYRFAAVWISPVAVKVMTPPVELGIDLGRLLGFEFFVNIVLD